MSINRAGTQKGTARLIRRLHHRGRKAALFVEHPDSAELRLEDGSEWRIWGMVVGSFKRFWA